MTRSLIVGPIAVAWGLYTRDLVVGGVTFAVNVLGGPDVPDEREKRGWLVFGTMLTGLVMTLLLKFFFKT